MVFVVAPRPVMNPPNRTRGIQICLVLYVLFAFIPGLHATLHPAGVDAPAMPTDTLLAEISASCPDGCENPEHRHLSPTHECPVCKTGWSPNAVPGVSDSGLPASDASQPLAHPDRFARRAPDIRIEQARAPPQSPPL